MKNLLKSLILIALFSLTLWSCKKDDTNPFDEIADSEQITQDDATVSEENIDSYDLSDDAILYAISNGREEDGRLEDFCVKPIVNKASKTITVDFGTGCTDKSGRNRKGKMIITYTGIIPSPTNGRTITFENYSVDGKEISGTITTSALQINADKTVQHSRTASNMLIKFTDGTTLKYNGNHTFILDINGKSDFSNKVSVKITGSSSGTSRKGVNFTNTISKALVTKFACAKVPVEGILEVTTDKNKASIDYGNGSCDKKVTVTVNGKSKEISLK
ncbi:MAG: hypothetical protein EAZ97_12375 [Bacteroidetes bacterium]|nr:MAG: hypothetical protein EAZ97_12375 [Bacteroidota bacterium]